MRRSFLYTYCCLTVLFSGFCSSVQHDQKIYSPEDGLVVWAFSDIQPRNIKERASFETAVKDVSDNFGFIHSAVVAGDIVQAKDHLNTSDDYEWFIRERSKLGILNWFEIAGNHDRNLDDYARYMSKPLHYQVLVGNILMIFVSDPNGRTSGTEVSDEVFLWWKNLVEKNQNKIIVTVTHSNLENVGFFYSRVKYRNIERSERFEKVLEKYRVDLWISGHTHAPSFLGMNEIVSEKYKTLFLNVAAIREDYFISHPESRFLLFKKESDVLNIKTRYHDDRAFVPGRELNYTLSKKFIWNGEKPKIIPYVEIKK